MNKNWRATHPEKFEEYSKNYYLKRKAQKLLLLVQEEENKWNKDWLKNTKPIACLKTLNIFWRYILFNGSKLNYEIKNK